MKSKVRVNFVEADNLEELKEVVSKELEVIQVNVRNIIEDIKTSDRNNSGYICQITYREVDEPEILSESVEVK
jgi:indole-3-glycerol phosphate synthase